MLNEWVFHTVFFYFVIHGDAIKKLNKENKTSKRIVDHWEETFGWVILEINYLYCHSLTITIHYTRTFPTLQCFSFSFYHIFLWRWLFYYECDFTLRLYFENYYHYYFYCYFKSAVICLVKPSLQTFFSAHLWIQSKDYIFVFVFVHLFMVKQFGWDLVSWGNVSILINAYCLQVPAYLP